MNGIYQKFTKSVVLSIYRRSMKYVTVSNLVNMLASYFKCAGISYINFDANIYCHIIQLNGDISEGSGDDDEIKTLVPYKRIQLTRNVKCWMSLMVEEECEHCKLSEKQFSQMEMKTINI